MVIKEIQKIKMIDLFCFSVPFEKYFTLIIFHHYENVPYNFFTSSFFQEKLEIEINQEIRNQFNVLPALHKKSKLHDFQLFYRRCNIFLFFR